GKGSIVLSLAVHVFVIIAIASITFRYPLSSLFRADRDNQATERVQFVRVQPAAAPSQSVGNGSNPKRAPRRLLNPGPLLPPSTIPVGGPPIPPPADSARAVSGTGWGSGGAPVSAAAGVEPTLPDPRIELRPNGL